MSIETAVRDAIQGTGMRVVDFAEEAGVSAPTVYSFLAGRSVNSFTLAKLAKHLWLALAPVPDGDSERG
jgi:predicted transcriptional regulator